MDFSDRNEIEIQRMVDQILEIAVNGLTWARDRESERLDREEDCVEWSIGDKNDEGYLIEELAAALPIHLSIIKTILSLQSEPVGSDADNVARLKGLLLAGRITNESIFNMVAACCDFFAFGWMTRHVAGQPPFRHYRAAQPVAASSVVSTEPEKIVAMAG